MSATCSNTHNEYNVIQFPKRTIICNNNSKTTNHSHTNYDVCTIADRFDPNITSSPPNIFVNTLKQRMDIYYANDTSLKLHMNHMSNSRNRALSLGQ